MVNITCEIVQKGIITYNNQEYYHWIWVGVLAGLFVTFAFISFILYEKLKEIRQQIQQGDKK